MVSVLTPNYGVLLVSLFLETMLYGCGLLQAWLYFHWYTKDHWGIKLMIVLLLVFETLQITFLFSATYSCLIDNFGNTAALDVINWQDSTQLLAGYLSALTVQLYFAFCIYILDKKNKIIPGLIVLLSLISIGAGFTQTVKAAEIKSFSKLESTKPTSTLQSASTLACDIAITISLTRTLSKHKAGIKSTNSMLNTLIVNAVNRGVLTALAAAINMVLFLATPDKFYFFLGLMLSSKLYMNSALATLNTRQHVMKKAGGGALVSDNDWRSIQLSNLPNSRSNTNDKTGSAPDGVQITVNRETFYNTTQTSTKEVFIDGMV